MNIKSTIKVNLALLFAVTVWSLAFVAIRAGLSGYTPGALALLRFTIASFCLLPLFPRALPLSLNRNQVLLCMTTGVVGIAAYAILLNTAEKTVPAALASFVAGQTPIVTSLLAVIWLRERPALITVVGIIVSCIGVSIIVAFANVAISINSGLILVAIAVVCGSMHSIMQKHLLFSLSPYVVTALSTWFATGFLLIFLPDLIKCVKTAPVDATVAVIFLGIVPSTLGQWLWTYALSRTLVVRATAYLYAMPLFSTIFGWWLLNEIPATTSLLGGMVALVGAALVKKDVTNKHDSLTRL